MVLSCLKSFLVDRTFLVKVNDSYSDPGVCVLEVPQGSVLGAFLFCVCVNDLVGAMPTVSKLNFLQMMLKLTLRTLLPRSLL